MQTSLKRVLTEVNELPETNIMIFVYIRLFNKHIWQNANML